MPSERQFELDGLTIHARLWAGEQTGLPLLALHGWLDNAASFDALGERWRGGPLLAMDMPGHGLSDNKPAHATYQIWDDLLVILAVADAMGWERFGLLGHSRGAIMSMLLASACPERVAALICLDGLVPEPVRAEDAPTQLANFLRDYRALPQRQPRVYASLEEVVAARQRAMPMGDAAARKIAERGASRVADGYTWNSDPRLKAASAFKLTETHLRALLAALKMPVLILLAEEGFGRFAPLDDLLPCIDQCRVERLPGSHHFHMEEAAADIARRIDDFLQAR